MTIKRFPEDFRVSEVLSPALKAAIMDRPGAYVLYRLEKAGLTTPDAVTAAARWLGLSVSGIAYAGLKDKHALTTQHITVRQDPVKPAMPEMASGKGWSLQRLGWVESPLMTASLVGNRFEITIRDLSRQACIAMDERAALLDATGEGRGHALLIVNYFGEQRFGSSRHGQGFPARALIKGDFEEALRLAIAVEARKDSRRQKLVKRAIVERWGKWKELLAELPRCPERRAVEVLVRSPADFRAAFCSLPYLFQQMTVQAYQSYLWNETARGVVQERWAHPGPLLESVGRLGKLLFPAVRSVPPELRNLDLPVLGYKSSLEEHWKLAAEAVLQKEGITTRDLRIPGVRRPFFGEAPRSLFIEAQDLELSKPEREGIDGKPARFFRVLSFTLPRGAYGTVLLRALGQ